MLFVLLVRKGSLTFSHNPFRSVFLVVSPWAVPIFQRRASKVSKTRLISLSKAPHVFSLVIMIAAHALLEPESC